MRQELSAALDTAKGRFELFRKHKLAFNPAGRNWYKLQAESGRATTIYIYDAIGFFGIEAEQLVREIDELDTDEITLRVNSPGGDVFDGIAIYNALVRHRATVNTKVDGLAASMASVIALAGDTMEMAPGSFLMIHKPWSIRIGSADELRREADLLDKIEGEMVGIYVNNSELSADEIRAVAAAETWYTADEAVEAGFADSVAEAEESVEDTALAFDLSVFQHAPAGLRSEPDQQRPTKRELEASLREAGLSQRAAKAMVSTGFGREDPDADLEDPEALEQLNQATQRTLAAFQVGR